MELKELNKKEIAETNGGGLIPLFIGAVIFGYKMEAMKNGNKWYEMPF
ncbi:hypothetical protein [Croceitalea vernalis]|uniref:Class IIb bacteriocin, lactobin A/cerein 7B family n=1 Tax=Croceitalea vernalis TaxID=3075599 RepID=A0ABU3BH24_9FLAO|nr:hypothetical protein [Croceitalea sp. P007]MDT0621431.1 hypothetical protein [Croceitalea sp. P007]